VRKLGVEVSYKKLYDWFRRWGYRKKVPWPMAEKADHQAQEAWKKEAVGSLAGGGAKARGMGP
jgi:transposase